LDFVADQLADGHRLRALTILDVFTRESVAIEVGPALKGTDVVAVLNRMRILRGVTKMFFCDNGSEFTSQIMDLWACQNGVKIDFSRPGKPTGNAFVETSNRTLRAECLDTHWFTTLAEERRTARLGGRNTMRAEAANRHPGQVGYSLSTPEVDQGRNKERTYSAPV
jgi:putative transposase